MEAGGTSKCDKIIPRGETMEKVRVLKDGAAAFRAAREVFIFKEEVEELLPRLILLIDNVLGDSELTTPRDVKLSDLIKQNLLSHPFFSLQLLERERKALEAKVGILYAETFRNNPATAPNSQEIVNLNNRLGAVLGITEIVNSWYNRIHLLSTDKTETGGYDGKNYP